MKILKYLDDVLVVEALQQGDLARKGLELLGVVLVLHAHNFRRELAIRVAHPRDRENSRKAALADLLLDLEAVRAKN